MLTVLLSRRFEPYGPSEEAPVHPLGETSLILSDVDNAVSDGDDDAFFKCAEAEQTPEKGEYTFTHFEVCTPLDFGPTADNLNVSSSAVLEESGGKVGLLQPLLDDSALSSNRNSFNAN